MKYFTFLLFAFATLIACKSENSVRDNAPVATTPSATTPTAPPAAAVNVVGGAHYVCTNPGCAGVGAAGAGSCEVCSNALAHNQGFHTQSTQTNTANEGLSPLFTNPQAATPSNNGSAPAAITSTPAPEPAQNANGVWHYTCSAGCAGGGGSAIACSSCGSTLAHNQGYH